MKLPVLDQVQAVVATVVALGLAFGGGVTGYAIGHHPVADLTTRVAVAESSLSLETASRVAIQKASQDRAAQAAQAIAAAQAAGRANTSEAMRLLSLSTPAEPDRCAAAQALIEKARP